MIYSGLNIGILGGGQLARMMIEETSKFGFNFIIYTEEENSPAGRIAYKEITGKFGKDGSLEEFLSYCDIITLENEFIDHQIIKDIEDKGFSVLPGSNIMKNIQDKYIQKSTLKNFNIPVSDFEKCDSEMDIFDFIGNSGFPVVIKSRTMGYDGKGNFKAETKEDIHKAVNTLKNRGELMVEKFINFTKELAIQVVRDKTGDMKFYPLVETIQKNHICHLVVAPYQDEPLTKRAEQIAGKILTEMNYIGVMGIEFFLSEDGDLIINELAPRVHNTGHYTIEGSLTSQFENHIRAVTGLPLGSTEMIYPVCVMINILGERDGKQDIRGMEELLKNQNTYLHNYCKTETRKGRKMGHITITGTDGKECIYKAEKYRNLLQI